MGLLNLRSAPAWHRQAECYGLGTDAMYPTDRISEARAKKVCENCIVRLHCLATALHNDEEYGIWGGFTEHERRLLAANALDQLHAAGVRIG